MDYGSILYRFELRRGVTVLQQSQRLRSKIKQESWDCQKLQVQISIHGDWNPNEDEISAVFDLMDEFRAHEFSLSNFDVEEIDPGIKEILTKASQCWKSLILSRFFSDVAFQFIHELIMASGGIQQLDLDSLRLSHESWQLLNSCRLGTGDKDSKISLPRLRDGIISQVLVSGFKEVQFEYLSSQAFRCLGQVLASPQCEISKLNYSQHDNMNCMFETVTTNSSVTDFCYTDNVEFRFNENNLCHTMKNLHKFKELRNLSIKVDMGSFDFLRPLLEIPDELKNPCIETLDIGFSPFQLCTFARLDPKKELDDSTNTLLLQVLNHYPKLRSFGSYFRFGPAIEYALCRNGRWRQFITRGLEVPLSLWCFVLEDVEKKHNPKALQEQEENACKDDDVDCKDSEESKEDNVGWGTGRRLVVNGELELLYDDDDDDDAYDYVKAVIVSNSIRYKLIKCLVRNHAGNFIVQ